MPAGASTRESRQGKPEATKPGTNAASMVPFLNEPVVPHCSKHSPPLRASRRLQAAAAGATLREPEQHRLARAALAEAEAALRRAREGI